MIDDERTAFVQTGVDVLYKLLPLTEPHLLAGDLSLEAFADGRILEEFQQLVEELRQSMSEDEADSSLRLEFLYVLAAAYIWTLRWHNRVSLRKSKELFVQEYATEFATRLEARLFSRFSDSAFDLDRKKFFYLFLTRGSYLQRGKTNSDGNVRTTIFVLWSDVITGISTVFERTESLLVQAPEQDLLGNAEILEQEFFAAAVGLQVYRQHQQGVANN